MKNVAQIQSVQDAQMTWSQEMNQKTKPKKNFVEIMIPLAKWLNTPNSLTNTNFCLWTLFWTYFELVIISATKKPIYFVLV